MVSDSEWPHFSCLFRHLLHGNGTSNNAERTKSLNHLVMALLRPSQQGITTGGQPALTALGTGIDLGICFRAWLHDPNWKSCQMLQNGREQRTCGFTFSNTKSLRTSGNLLFLSQLSSVRISPCFGLLAIKSCLRIMRQPEA